MIFGVMAGVFSYILLSSIALSAYAESQGVGLTEPMVVKTDRGSLYVEIRFWSEPEPNKEAKMQIRFLQPDLSRIQLHVDYAVVVEDANGSKVFEHPVTHSTPGIEELHVTFPAEGPYSITVKVSGILFIPIPEEQAVFSVRVIPEFPVAIIIITSAVAVLIVYARVIGYTRNSMI
ncbi:MAG: hypothetical protein RMJ59_04375 [Candidatus Nitrosocaldus sp.]|nr:hypothetical protein [Candidatus Nitrosocaldus sp.]MDW8275601.1 hypothetical protein [Candidatus Nitrosocaldus sp.]